MEGEPESHQAVPGPPCALLPPAIDELLSLCVFQYEVSDDSFFQNMLNFYNFSSRVMADQLRKTPNKDQ